MSSVEINAAYDGVIRRTPQNQQTSDLPHFTNEDVQAAVRKHGSLAEFREEYLHHSAQVLLDFDHEVNWRRLDGEFSAIPQCCCAWLPSTSIHGSSVYFYEESLYKVSSSLGKKIRFRRICQCCVTLSSPALAWTPNLRLVGLRPEIYTVQSKT